MPSLKTNARSGSLHDRQVNLLYLLHLCLPASVCIGIDQARRQNFFNLARHLYLVWNHHRTELKRVVIPVHHTEHLFYNRDKFVTHPQDLKINAAAAMAGVAIENASFFEGRAKYWGRKGLALNPDIATTSAKTKTSQRLAITSVNIKKTTIQLPLLKNANKIKPMFQELALKLPNKSKQPKTLESLPRNQPTLSFTPGSKPQLSVTSLISNDTSLSMASTSSQDKVVIDLTDTLPHSPSVRKASKLTMKTENSSSMKHLLPLPRENQSSAQRMQHQ